MDEQKMMKRFLDNEKNEQEIIKLTYIIQKKYAKSAVLHYYIASFFENRKRYALAMFFFEKAILCDHLFIDPYFNLCELYLKNEVFPEVSFEKADKLLQYIYNRRMKDYTTSERLQKVVFEDNVRVIHTLTEPYMKHCKYAEIKVFLEDIVEQYTAFKGKIPEHKIKNVKECWYYFINNLSTVYLKEAKIKQCIDITLRGYLKRPKWVPRRKEIELSFLQSLLIDMHYYSNYKEHLEFIKKEMKYLLKFEPFFKKERNDKIRIGYISPDINKNAVSLFISHFFTAYSKDKFEVYVYYTNDFEDTYTAMFKEYQVEWVDAKDMNNDELMFLVKELHEIDILVDLAGHGNKNKMEFITKRPAPIIINYIGFPDSYYVPADKGVYRIVDKITDKTPDISEEPLYLPCFICFNPFKNEEVPKIDYIEEPGTIRIGILNKFIKHSPYTLSLWKRVLEQERRIVLVMKVDQDKLPNDIYEEYYKDLPSQQIEFLEFKEKLQNYYSLFNSVDFCVDTFPYSGTTTTCSALYMGVPTYTIYNSQNRHVENVSASILKNAGLDSYVAKNEDEFVKKVLSNARNFRDTNENRMKIRNRFLKSMDPDKFMSEYEKQMIRIYEEHL